MRWTCLAWALLGCGRIGFDAIGGGAPGAGPPRYVSGSRLRAIRNVSAEGGDLFVGFHDTQLDIDCTFAVASDGVPRCVPANGQLGYYNDAGCTTAVAYGDAAAEIAACDEPMRYATAYNNNMVTAYTLGTAWTGMIYSQNAMCTATSERNGLPYYLVGPEAPPSTFVAATESIVPGGRLSYIEFEADDGARQRSGELFDNVLQQRCTWFELEPGHASCLPGPAFELQLGFADAACTQPAIVAIAFTSAPTMAIVGGTNLCGTDPHLYKLGSELGSFYTKPSTGGCTAGATFSQDVHAFANLGELPLDPYETAMVVPDAGTSRVRQAWLTTGDGVYSPDVLWDDMSHGRCTVAVDDKTLRSVCSPFFRTGAQVFSDPGCMTPTEMIAPTCLGAPFLASGLDGVVPQHTCNGDSRNIYLFDQPFTPPVSTWTRDLAGTCAPIDLTGVEMWTIAGQPSDVTPLVTLQREVE